MTRLLAAAALLGLILTAPAAAQVTDTAPFLEACNAVEPEGFGLDASQGPAFCGCLATGFSSRSQADLDILAADLRGESTAETHAAHGNYEELEEAARDAVDACVAEVTEAATADNPELARVSPDMAEFDANCRASTRLRDYLADAPKGADAAVESTCSCTSAEFSVRFSQPIVDYLGAQLAAADPSTGVTSATDEQEAAGQEAEQIMGQCLSTAMAS